MGNEKHGVINEDIFLKAWKIGRLKCVCVNSGDSFHTKNCIELGHYQTISA